MYEEVSDECLIERLREGEDQIMDYIMEKYKPLVRKKTNALFLIGGDTDDLIQEGMIGLFKAVRDFRMDKDASFYHFAEICITRQLYSALEASNRKKHMPLNTYISFSLGEGENGVSLEDMISEHSESPEQMVIEKEVREEFFYRLKKELSKMECEVLNLYLDGNNYLQIAQILKKEPKAIDNALQRIRQKIRNLEN
ncbi:MAG: sigma-70 family RNA polymerase sigma factor [Agathobacter sp.]|nr:sigma-70 family RNA polymerase sigma factor [Agathobacter sp.]